MSKDDQPDLGLSGPFEESHLASLDQDRMVPGRYTVRTENLSDRAIGGGLYIIVTLGLYYFFFLTRERRSMWSNTLVDGNRLKFVGSAIGSFFRFALSVICYGAVGVAAYVIWESNDYDVMEKAGLLGACGLLFFGLWQFFSYHRIRYLISHTMWGNFRFRSKGLGIGYVLASYIWLVLSILTLGLLVPFMRASLRRMQIRSIEWNGLKFKSNLNSLSYAVPFLLIWVSFFLSLSFIVFRSIGELPSTDIFDYIVVIPEEYSFFLSMPVIVDAFNVLRRPLEILVAIYSAILIVSLPYFYGRARRVVLSSIRCAETAIESRFKCRSVYSSFIMTALAMLLIWGVAGGLAFALYQFAPRVIDDLVIVQFVQVIGYFILIMIAAPATFWAFWVGWVNRLWSRSIRTLVVGPMGAMDRALWAREHGGGPGGEAIAMSETDEPAEIQKT